MIDFRYHLVSIIAIFFALAAGIVLGAGPLGEKVNEDLPGQLSAMREENRTLREDLESAQADLGFQEDFLEELTPRLVGNSLSGEHVAVIAMPGADADSVEALQASLEQAGATAELRVRIEPTWTDPDSEATLDSLASDLVTSGTELSEDADGFQRGATVLAAALLAQPDGDAAAGETVDTATVTAFEESGLIDLEQDASTAPTLAVAVAGSVSGDDAEDRVNRLVTLTTELDAQSAGAVAAGPADTAEEGGLIATIRSDGDAAENVSTVDSVNLPSGRISLAFALAEQNEGGVGHYGVVGETDGVLPPVPASPTTTEGSSEETP